MPATTNTREKASRTAVMTNPYSVFGSTPQSYVVRRAKSRATGAVEVRFHVPGWRAMAAASMEAAVRKVESHPGFVRWEA
ncbi:hypothetical protein [Phenylobacterium immobile]|uniref:hypothetical protein n=1 Tax=Phenylobacterium immobile TaxID=21 RepID=UPI000B0825BC|nr:hypothetical protein [Phenylobacterium immobile]